jgi:hypothetical protein
MKTLTVLYFLTICLFTSCIANDFRMNESNFNSTDKKYSFITSYKVSTPADLNISTSGGNIETSGYSTDSVVVAFIVIRKDKVLDISFDELNKIADIEIVYDKNKLQILVKKIHERNLSIGFMIKTPIQTSAQLNTSGGNISVDNLTGILNVNTSGGNVDLDKLNGQVKANTSGGNVSLSNINAECEASTSGGNIDLKNIIGKLNVSTSGGNIDVNNTKPQLNASTSGGNIDLKNVQGITDVNTSGGSINIKQTEGSVKAITSGGDIDADLTKLVEKLYLETSGGNIHAKIPSGQGLDLDISAEEINTQLVNFSGTSKKDRIKGQMNGGGVLVQLSTSGGSISLDYK